MTAEALLNHFQITKCPFCECLTVEPGWDFLNQSEKEVIECPVCKERIYINELTEQGLGYVISFL